MTYNEYAQVLEAKNPKTGELYTADRLQRRLATSEVGVGMLQDAIWADGEKLESRRRLPGPRRSSSLTASLKGWVLLPRQRRGVRRHRRGARARSSARATSCGR